MNIARFRGALIPSLAPSPAGSRAGQAVMAPEIPPLYGLSFTSGHSVEGSMPKKEYSGEEDWKNLESLPYAVSITVMAAAPSLLGAWGETRAMIEEPPRLAAASGSELVGLVSAGIQPGARELIKEQQNLLEQDQMGYRSRTVAACRSAATALAAAPPDEAEAYKKWLLQIGEKVALAAKEHGVAFSDPEKTALGEIAVAPGIQA